MELCHSLSICVPTYNRLDMLKTALGSLYKHLPEGRPWEVVVSDNASTDGSAEWIEEQSFANLTLLRQPATVSMYANHNECINTATGEWILFLHSDDVVTYNPYDDLDAFSRWLEIEPQISVVMPARPIHKSAEIPTDLRGSQGAAQLLRWPSSIPSGTFYRRVPLREAGFNVETISADLEYLFVQLAVDNTVQIVPSTCVEVTLGSHQATAMVRRRRGYIAEISGILRRQFSTFPSLGGDLTTEFQSMNRVEKRRTLLILHRARMWLLALRLVVMSARR